VPDLDQLLGPIGLGVGIVIGLGLHRNVRQGRAEFRRWTRTTRRALSLRDVVLVWLNRVQR
jgi:hypothetical protein